jgi:hypothetical protein
LIAVPLCLVATSVANAAKPPPKPKPKACNLLVDGTDDGSWSVAPPVKASTLDVVGGDIATGKTKVVAVLRMASTNVAADPYSNLGYEWNFAATSLGVSYAFWMRMGIGKTGKPLFGATVGTAAVPVEFKVDGNSYVWTMKRSDAPNLARPRNVFTEFRGGTKVESSSADTALTTTTKYADKDPSCIAAP